MEQYTGYSNEPTPLPHFDLYDNYTVKSYNKY